MKKIRTLSLSKNSKKVYSMFVIERLVSLAGRQFQALDLLHQDVYPN